MARRKLSHQQKRRIRKAQDAVDIDDINNHRGIVISHRGGEVEVETEQGQALFCHIRSNLGTIVCGDRVIYREEDGKPAIIAILPRDNLLQRLDGFGQNKSVAANVTQLLICLAVEPEPNRFLLDQYLLSAEQQGLETLIILNKIDLYQGSGADPFELRAVYQAQGYAVLHTSIKQNHNVDLLQQACIDQVNVISGVSGVGKSSLTKAILPDIEIPIGEISEVNREGRHTTRASRLYHLPLGGELIDTPGVRGFNPLIDNGTDIAHGFREIRREAQACRFSNCRHLNEPGCAVLAAVADATIDGNRYNSYLKLMQALD